MKKFGSVEEYVKELGGKRTIRKILISNNGLSALKGIRSMKEWEYETFGKHEIKFVVMPTPEDINANAEFIHHGDVVRQSPGGSNENNYANVRLIVELAVETGCDAVWPGWGHASEYPELPKQLSEKGIQFIGPDHISMNILGDKISSSIIAEKANVPTIPWSGSGLKCEGNFVSNDLYTKACINSEEDAVERAKKIGYPIMIKASEGGGGKGIRKARKESQLRSGYNQVRKEVPGSPIFLMRLAERNRHLEVQLIADQYNNAVALYSRDCSVQRRHQKIIEEGPVSVAPREIVKKMEQAAVALSKCVKYQNAGTVEYLYDDGHFYFLELNPRLQVEHPVSEWITEVNLPAIQLQVAMGIPLDRIPDIRKFYGKTLYGNEKIDFDRDEPVPPNGHTIAVRVTAENPENGFLGTSGSINELAFSPTRNCWGYFSVRIPGGIHSYSDSQFGHIFSHGTNREEARRNMVVALSRLNVRGKISNTSKYIMNLLELDTFKNNKHNTAWLDQLIEENENLVRPDQYLVVICGALHVMYTASQENKRKWVDMVHKGQYPDPSYLQTDFPVELVYDDIKYKLIGYNLGCNRCILEMEGSYKEAEIKPLKDSGILVIFDGESHVVYGREDNQGLRITVDGKVCLFPEESDPSMLKATCSGKVVKFLAEDGDHLETGQPFIEVEVMKMILQMKVQLAGKIKYETVEGSIINQGDLLGTVELDDKMQVKKLERNEEPFPGRPQMVVRKKMQKIRPQVVVEKALSELKCMLTGYGVPSSLFKKRMERAIEELDWFGKGDVILVHKFVETMAVVRTSLPIPLQEELNELLKKGFFEGRDEKLLERLLETYLRCEKEHFKNPVHREEFLAKSEPLRQILLMAKKGMLEYAYFQIVPLLEVFLNAERPFDNFKPKDRIMTSLRTKHVEELDYCFEIALAHQNRDRNIAVVKALLEAYDRLGLFTFNDVIVSSFASFRTRQYREIVAFAKQMIMKHRLPSFRKSEKRIRSVFEKAIKVSDGKRLDILKKDLINNPNLGFDVLLSFFSDPNREFQDMAIGSYIRKTYASFEIQFHNVNQSSKNGFTFTTYTFSDNSENLNDNVSINLDVVAGSMNPYASHENLDSLNNLGSPSADTEAPSGFGIFGIFNSLEDFYDDKNVEALLNIFSDPKNTTDDHTVLSILIKASRKPEGPEDEFVESLGAVIRKHSKILEGHDIRRVTLVLKYPDLFPNYYTFRRKLDYQEEPIYRNIEPTLSYHLEVRKMSNYQIVPYPLHSTGVHLFLGRPKRKMRGRYGHLGNRFFVRTIIFHSQDDEEEEEEKFDNAEGRVQSAEKYLLKSLDALEHAMSDTDIEETFGNHIYCHYIPVVKSDAETMKLVIQRFQKQYAQRMIDLRVSEMDIRLNVIQTDDNERFIPIRMFITNKTRYRLSIDVYLETKDPMGVWRFTPLWGINNDLDRKPVKAPYPLMNTVDLKRAVTQHVYQTTYVYDFPALFERAVKQEWNKCVSEKIFNKSDIPNKLVKAVELTLNEDKKLVVLEDQQIGNNLIGMVAWKLTLRTPSYPQGQDVIVIANDITFMSGSFGPLEDELFDRASKLSRELGIPRIYITGNSGARIGLAEEVKKLFRVCWVDPKNQSKGFQYLYITPEDYNEIKDSVNVEKIVVELPDGGGKEERLKIVDIIGRQHGIGVECLQGSGMIAGETSRAYQEVFTLSYVAARTVGIGAYLVRLGQRIIQNIKPPIILTGASALNRLLGRQVYVSHNQLGGTQIMYPNGVTHLVSQDDLEATQQMVRWLSYIPNKMGSPLPILPTHDPVKRRLEVLPPTKDSSKEYDPRDFLKGKMDEKGEFLPGFFDQGSWFETLKGWAKSIVVARARLGGIPCGCVCVETVMKEEIIPADPAEENSQEQIIPKAGQVWFPDSAFKTAQAIMDFNKGEQLPMFIFANWRGFSGGQRDMFKEVLKYGSYIVDALVDFKKPIFIYLPPYAELRGGAWVVVDPKINEDCIEMFCDTRSRGGVLEPSGTIEIKYKKRDIVETMRRIDPVLLELKKKLDDEEEESEGEDERKRLEGLISKREKEQYISYHNIAIKFADLHDTPGRMFAKNGIGVIPWEESREFFYYRLRRRIIEFDIYDRIGKHSGGVIRDKKKKIEILKSWIGSEVGDWRNDTECLDWYLKNEEKVKSCLIRLKEEDIRKKIEMALLGGPSVVLQEIKKYVSQEKNKEFKKNLLSALLNPF